MSKRIFIGWVAVAALAFANIANAQEFPIKTVKLTVPYPPGGTTDELARLLSEKLRLKWNQVVLVDNRGGAGGNIGAEAVWRSPGDGYNLMFASPGPLAINQNLYPKLGYEPGTFVPISIIAATPNVLVANPKVPYGTLAQLIAYARENPDKISYASQGPGSTSHLTTEMFKSMAGVKITHVPYKGSSPAIADVIAGQCDIMFVEYSSVQNYIKAGNLRLLAVASEKRQPNLPDTPSVSEALPGFVSSTWFALAAPPGTPQPIADKVSAAVADAIKQPDMVKRLSELSVAGVGSTPAEMDTFVKQETERWRNVIRTTGTNIE